MRASVNPEMCAGHGACVTTCPDVFTITDDGYAEVTVAEIPAALADLTRQAANQCPERAITIEN